ncbi:30S ribosomal protein S1 [Galdieria sulphuraria]|nr:30S ribosomal protein S1 [Galdieria sulphuraria]
MQAFVFLCGAKTFHTVSNRIELKLTKSASLSFRDAPASIGLRAFPKHLSEITSLRSDAAVNASVSYGEEGSPQLSVSDLVIGETYTGIVKNVTNYGAFVDIGANKLGLLHISQMSNRFVNHPNEVVSSGSQVTVRVYKIDVEKDQFSLTMKTQEPRRRRNDEPENVVEALRSFAEQVDRHEFRKGRVVNVTDFGAFVDIDGPKDGLVFRADMTDDLEVDDEIQVRVKKIDLSRKFITLSMKPITEYEEENMSFVRE